MPVRKWVRETNQSLYSLVAQERAKDAAVEAAVEQELFWLGEALRLAAIGSPRGALKALNAGTRRRPAARRYPVAESYATPPPPAPASPIPMRSRGATAEECRRFYNRRPSTQAGKLVAMLRGCLGSTDGECG